MLKLINQTFCPPLDSILEIATIPAEHIHRHKEQIIFEHRGRIISVIEIEKILGLIHGRVKNGDSSPLVILRGEEETQKAIVADEILDQKKNRGQGIRTVRFSGNQLFMNQTISG